MSPTLKTLRLRAPHRHAGRDYPIGAVLDLPAASAAWLIGLGVAEAVEATTPAPAPAARGKEKEEKEEKE